MISNTNNGCNIPEQPLKIPVKLAEEETESDQIAIEIKAESKKDPSWRKKPFSKWLLPSGDYTQDVLEYSYAWKSLAEQFLQLTGFNWQLHTYDPDLVFRTPNWRLRSVDREVAVVLVKLGEKLFDAEEGKIIKSLDQPAFELVKDST